MKKILLIALAVVLLIGISFTIVLYSIEGPPLKEINEARIKITEAEKLKSSKFATSLIAQAHNNYRKAMAHWKNENEKFILFRDYSATKELATQAHKLAKQAIDKAKINISDAKNLIALRITNLENKVNETNRKYNKFPYNTKDRNELVKSKLLLNEARLAFTQANYDVSIVKLDSVEIIISSLLENYEVRLADYFNDYSQWDKWVIKTINYSKKNKTYCIIVDKYARECILYKNGLEQQKFEVELGSNWLGNKNQQGDKSTPEGMYKVESKKFNGKTKYYKAFLLNYPNEDDKKRFLQNKKSGIIKGDAKIGNLIEIHGNGGKGIDWTDGCVALLDSDMDKLFNLCTEGTMVTIVGSINPLIDIIN